MAETRTVKVTYELGGQPHVQVVHHVSDDTVVDNGALVLTAAGGWVVFAPGRWVKSETRVD